MLVRATIEILFDADDATEACDAIAETMRPLLREFSGANAPFIDWRYTPAGEPEPHDGAGFEYSA